MATGSVWGGGVGRTEIEDGKGNVGRFKRKREGEGGVGITAGRVDGEG